ncbi:hypothetical protein [Mesorhizobium sp.]|uniref:hypothetical protein n=1 Tax=Mesorhizobium sp. TaxID=1871066 RepID=UPI000FE327EC|nr:hypothetical protein [Mesorhizobium sp.]RWO01671.1 MAG: hypothetical protein EOS06_05410 [Mesorhizobium sp.]
MFNKVFPQLDTSTSRHFRDWWCSNEVVNGLMCVGGLRFRSLGLMLAADFGMAAAFFIEVRKYRSRQHDRDCQMRRHWRSIAMNDKQEGGPRTQPQPVNGNRCRPRLLGRHVEVYIDSRVEPKVIKDVDLELAQID